MTTYNDLHDVETRVTDEKSGGQKGKKLTQLGALDPVALIEVARVAGFGANKYAAFNFLKGYDWSLSYNAGMRHAMLFWAGEERDAESGQLHAAMAAWHFLTLVSFTQRGVGNDDRPPKLPADLDLTGATIGPVVPFFGIKATIAEAMGQLAYEPCIQHPEGGCSKDEEIETAIEREESMAREAQHPCFNCQDCEVGACRKEPEDL